MIHRLRGMPSCVSLCVLAAGVALAACDRKTETRMPSGPSPSAVVIGTAPSEAKSETAGTTPVQPEGKELDKATEQRGMPLPGQPNDHSNLATNPSQKAGSVDAQQTPERK